MSTSTDDPNTSTPGATPTGGTTTSFSSTTVPTTSAPHPPGAGVSTRFTSAPFFSSSTRDPFSTARYDPPSSPITRGPRRFAVRERTEIPGKDEDQVARTSLKSVDKLRSDGKNYTPWSTRLLSAFRLGRVDDVVDGTFPMPSEKDSEELWRAWDTKDERAISYLFLALEDEQIPSLANLTSAQAWAQLRDKYALKKKELYQYIMTGLIGIKTSSDAEIKSVWLPSQEKLYASARANAFPLVRHPAPDDSEAVAEDTFAGNIAYGSIMLEGLPKTPHWRTFVDIYSSDPSSTYHPRDIIDRVQAELQKLAARSRDITKNPILDTAPAESALASPRTTSTRPDCPFCHQTKPTHAPEKCWSNPSNPDNRLKSSSSPKTAKKGSKSPKKKGGKAAATSKVDEDDGQGESFVEVEGSIIGIAASGGAAFSTPLKTDEWFLDSCASRSMTGNREAFDTLSSTSDSITTADGHVMKVEGVGTIKVRGTFEGHDRTIKISNVYYVPNCRFNILSVPSLQRAGVGMQFEAGTSKIIMTKDGKGLLDCEVGSFNLPVLVRPSTVVNIVHSTPEARLNAARAAHHRYGHPGQGQMRELLKSGAVEGFTYPDIAKLFEAPCEVCVKSKATATPYPTTTGKKTIKPLEVLHTDLAGPLRSSLGGARYFVLLVDEATGYVEAEPLKEKSETLAALKRMLLKMRTVFKGLELSATTSLQSDNGTEFINSAVKEWTDHEKIFHRRSVPGNPQQNGRAERYVRLVKEKITSLLLHLSLSDSYWAEAMRHAIFILNRLPRVPNEGRSPYEVIHGRPDPSVKTLPTFGQRMYALKPNAAVFQPKAEDCRFMSVGLSDGVKAYRIIPIVEHGVGVPRYTRTIWLDKKSAARGLDQLRRASALEDDEESGFEKVDSPTASSPLSTPPESPTSTSAPITPKTTAAPRDNESTPALREKWGAPEGTTRIRKPTWKVAATSPSGEHLMSLIMTEPSSADKQEPPVILISTLEDAEESEPPREVDLFDRAGRPPPVVPKSVEEALSSVYAKEWKSAMDEEKEGLLLQGAWELVPPEPGKHVIGSRWAFSVKHDEHGEPTKLKARLVIQAVKTLPILQGQGAVYTPLPNWPLVSSYLAVAAGRGSKILSIDFTKGYMAAEATGGDSAPLLMKQPPGLEDPEHPHYVCRLRKALYGVPQSGRAFHLRVREFLETTEIVNVSDDVTIFVGTIDGDFFSLILYVDNALIACTDEGVEKFLIQFADEFDIKVEGNLEDGLVFLGKLVKYERATKAVTVSQAPAIDTLLAKFELSNVRKVDTPIQKGVVYAAHDGQPVNLKAYQSVVGSLNWIAQTRADISFATNMTGRFASNPGPQHWRLVMRILKYLAATKDVVLVLKGIDASKPVELRAFADADFAGDVESRRSTSGIVVQLDQNLIFHSSKRQGIVTTSTYGAEFVAMVQALKEIEWFSSLLPPLLSNSPLVIPSPLFTDNASAVVKINSSTFAEQTKALDVKVKYLREQVEKGFIRVSWIPSEANVADLLTKALSSTTMKRHAETIGYSGFPA